MDDELERAFDALTPAPGMSNFDHSIDEDLEEYLVNGGEEATHAAWDFNGKLWYKDGLFYEEVWVYHVPQETISASTLPDLMKVVNDKYGWG